MQNQTDEILKENREKTVRLEQIQKKMQTM